MAKKIFRFLRGEINGFYLTNLYDTLNLSTEDIKLFLTNFNNIQFKPGYIQDKDLYGLGKFAGIFLPRVSITESMTSLRMSDEKIVDDVEYSERGLFYIPLETFNYYHLSESETEDINTLATETERSSMVGDEDIIGYISESADNVILSDGTVNPEVISKTPPASGAYSDYYGDQFLFLSEMNTVYSDVDPSLYIELYKALQIVRYNGASIKSLCDIINVLCPNGMVKISSIEVGADKLHINVYYNYDSTVTGVTYKQQRLSLLDYLIGEKFKQVMLVENEIQED